MPEAPGPPFLSRTVRAVVRGGPWLLVGVLSVTVVVLATLLVLVGSAFSRRVLAAVTTIPYGELWTYGDVAGMAGSQSVTMRRYDCGTTTNVEVRNRTVITAVDSEHMREHVFTNIDSAVIS